jgi:structure-specific endonuclease subunit SLX1
LPGLMPQADMDSTARGVHVVPLRYTVYLLQLVPKPRSFYIGSTPDPARRLRQHNGELSAGAYRTLRTAFQPWRIVCLVRGFPSKVAALQFEHAWQHPFHTRHIAPLRRVLRLRTQALSLHHRMANLRLLLTSDFFGTLPISATVLGDVSVELELNKFDIVVPAPKLSVCADLMATLALPQELEAVATLTARLVRAALPCGHCQRYIDIVSHLPDTACDLNELLQSGHVPLVALPMCGCDHVSHLTCMARDAAGADSIVPQRYQCRQCGATSQWVAIARVATLVREHMLRGVQSSS